MKPKIHLEFEIDSVEGPTLNDAYFVLNYTVPIEYFDYVKVNETEEALKNKTETETSNDGENRKEDVLKNKTETDTSKDGENRKEENSSLKTDNND